MSIPWEHEPQATSVYTQRVKEEIRELHHIFEESETAKIATNTLVEEILLSKLRYHNTKTDVPDFEREVPFDLNKIIRAMVTAVIQTGYFAYRIIEGSPKKRKRSTDASTEDESRKEKRINKSKKGGDDINESREGKGASRKDTNKSREGDDAPQKDKGGRARKVGGRTSEDDTHDIKEKRAGALTLENQQGSPTIEVAHPLRTFPDILPDGTLVARDNAEHRLPGTKSVEWNAVFFRDPVFIKYKQYVINSALRAAAPNIAKLRDMIENFGDRDRHNSAHTGFAVVNPNLATMGSGQTWFAGRDAQADSSIAPYLARNMDFKQIVEERSKTIRMLGEQTAISRQRLQTQTQNPDAQPVSHTEHIVTDGYTFSQAEPLHSLGNAQHHYDRLETAILFSLGVPPQALGKNINSERLASSNSLTQAALKVFNGTVRRFKHAAQDIIKRASTTDETYIAFSTCVQAAELADLVPYLKPGHAQHLLACAHHIPPHWFDTESIVKVQQARVNTSKGVDTQKPGMVESGKSDEKKAEKYQKQNA
jgi:hypothetical protein